MATQCNLKYLMLRVEIVAHPIIDTIRRSSNRLPLKNERNRILLQIVTLFKLIDYDSTVKKSHRK